MAVLQGAVSIVWGNAVTGVTYTGSGSVTSSSESWSQESDSVEIKDMGGDTVGVYYYNYRNKLSLTVFPSGSSANVTLPTIGMKVTITSANDSKQAGDFVCTSISQDRKADGIVEFKMDLTKWDSLTVQ
jgi:hypothetical protein